MRLGHPVLVPASSAPQLELLGMYAACVEPKLGGALMKALVPAAPLAGLQHLKRVRKSPEDPSRLHVLLCPVAPCAAGGSAADCQAQTDCPAAAAGPADGPISLDSLPEAVRQAVQGFSLQQLFIAQVSRHAPRTREQATEWGRYWPISWRPPDPGAHARAEALPEHEAEVMRRHMARALALVRQAVDAGGACNACVIVDPASGRVVAEAVDGRRSHPLHHAAMRAVASVARWQLRVWPPGDGGGGGASSTQLSLQQQQSASGGEQQRAQVSRPEGSAFGLEEQEREEEGGKRRRVAGSHDVREAADLEHHCRPVQQEQQEQAQQGSCPEAQQAEEAQVQQAEQQQVPLAELAVQPAGLGPRPYLCTGYDAYLASEPCVMCAMALVHSRLRRVVYSAADQAGGALGGALRLHSQRSLNHHYAVYRVPLLNECGGGD